MHIDHPIRTFLIGAQMIFVAFGALVLVPILVGLHPSIALFTAGAGTLLFSFITQQKVPVFLASSFAFIAPMQFALEQFGYGATFTAMASAGLLYAILAALVYFRGRRFLDTYLPPIVTGPIIIVIGLSLSDVAIKMAVSWDSQGTYNGKAALVSAFTFAVAVLMVRARKRILNVLPIILAITAGYFLCLVTGWTNLVPVKDAPWLVFPWSAASEAGMFEAPSLSIHAILYMLPVAIVPAIEHVGDILAIGSVTKRDYLKDPGLHRTMLGDGLATMLAGFLGGPPNTTYSEVTGAVAITRAFKVIYMQIAAGFAILLAFVGKLGALLQSIPKPVMGGVLTLVFGMIAAVGIGTLIRNKADFENPRNYLVVAVILVVGIGDLQWSFGSLTIGGLGLAGILGITLNRILALK
ncbi:MAG: uracil-xanthine permease family protein [Verrucomicrobiae bacterium]|nr:uracil-xanthine permease family protein [Verrucomicrobiae bacterium]